MMGRGPDKHSPKKKAGLDGLIKRSLKKEKKEEMGDVNPSTSSLLSHDFSIWMVYLFPLKTAL